MLLSGSVSFTSISKTFPDFRATSGNLRVLLYGSFKQNTATLEQEIKDALAELERQLYIRRKLQSIF